MKPLVEIIERVAELTPKQQEDLLEILKKWQAEKHREFQRLSSRIEVDVLVGDRVLKTQSRDISAGGIFIRASGKLEPEKNVRIVFSVPGHPKPFKLQGTVVRVEKTGWAICFENTTPYFKKILNDVIWLDQDPGENPS